MGIAAVVNALEGLADYRSTHKMEFYVPYPFQKAFHYAKEGQVYTSGHYEVGDGNLAEERALISANQIGKTLCAAMESAFHLTGDYPKAGEHFYPEFWPGTEPPVPCPFAGQDIYPNGWEGLKFNKPVSLMCIGKSNDSVMKVIQNELMGDPLEQPESHGTGTIPKDKIVKTYRKPGVVNALSSVLVKHVSGKNSRVWFLAYEQDVGTIMGTRFDVAWPDEEPPSAVMSQLKRGQLSKDKKGIYSTFTPEDGVTTIVDQLLNNMDSYQAVVRAGWDDAPHMTPEKREKELKKFQPHERDMRSKGIPLMGAGLIFEVPDEEIMCNPFDMPAHWPRIGGIDIGYNHPFAGVWAAHDRDNDVVYIYDCYRESKATIGSGAFLATTASACKHRGDWIPIAWPHDGLKEDPKSGVTIAQQYREEGLTNLLPEKFSNPPAPGQKEGQGGNGVEAGIFEMNERMETGRLKVFSNLNDWFEEKRQYHRKHNENTGRYEIVRLREDLMSASRYAVQSLRFARTRPRPRIVQSEYEGITNW